MLLVDVASASSEVGAVSSRLTKISRIATLLGAAASSGDADQVAVVVSWLSGELPHRQIGAGWAALRTLPQPADEPTLAVAHVDAAFTEIGAVAGTRSQKHRVALAGRCSPQRPRPSRRSCVVFCKVSCARAHWPA